MPQRQNEQFDVRELIKAGDRNAASMQKAFNSRPEHKTILTKRGLRSVYSNGAKWNNYKNGLLN